MCSIFCLKNWCVTHIFDTLDFDGLSILCHYVTTNYSHRTCIERNLIKYPLYWGLVFYSKFEQVNESYITMDNLSILSVLRTSCLSYHDNTTFTSLTRVLKYFFENVFLLKRYIAIPDNTQQLNLWTTVYFLLRRGTLIN